MLLNRNISNVDVPNAGSPVQVGCPVLPGADADMLMKVFMGLNFENLMI